MINRRVFSKTSFAAMFGYRGFAADKLTLHVGHTGLTWIPLGGAPGPSPPINPMADPQYVEAVIRDIAGLGYR